MNSASWADGMASTEVRPMDPGVRGQIRDKHMGPSSEGCRSGGHWKEQVLAKVVS